MSTRYLLAGLAVTVWAVLAVCVLPLAAAAVPEADHVHLELDALRLNVNNYSLKHQVKVLLTVTAEDEDRFSGVDLALLTITNPVGEEVTLGHHKYVFNEKRFKAANAVVLFKAVEDSTAPMPSEMSNVPTGFFCADGPYQVLITLRGESITGGFSFSDALGMEVSQDGGTVSNFCLAAESPFEITTTPSAFGPVYYKRQDVTNFVYQMASMDAALESGDFHAPVESPLYIFQVRAGDGDGGPTRLIDPSRYIEGWEEHLIRSDKTATPLVFPGHELDPGEVVVVDFLREDTPEPDSVFRAEKTGFSSRVKVTDRVVFALHAESPPTAAELGLDG